MGGLGVVMEDSWLQKVGMEPRICTYDEKTPSPPAAWARAGGRRGVRLTEGGLHRQGRERATRPDVRRRHSDSGGCEVLRQGRRCGWKGTQWAHRSPRARSAPPPRRWPPCPCRSRLTTPPTSVTHTASQPVSERTAQPPHPPTRLCEVVCPTSQHCRPLIGGYCMLDTTGM